MFTKMAYREKLTKYELPLLPLRGITIFPGVSTGFDISRKMSMLALQSALASPGKLIFAVTQRDIECEIPKENDLYTVGTIARIKQSVRLPDKHYRIILEGIERAEVLAVKTSEDGSMKAEVMEKKVFLDDNGGLRGEAFMRQIKESLSEYVNTAPDASKEVFVNSNTIGSLSFLSDYIASSIFEEHEKSQQILEEFDPLKKAELLLMFLERETEIWALEHEISDKVKSKFDTAQRNALLKEKIHMLQDELNGGNGFSTFEDGDDEDNYKNKILEKALPKEVEERLLKENAKLAKMPFGSGEATVIQNYIETCLEIPWTKRTKDRVDVLACAKILEADHYGMEDVKKRILEFIAVKQLAPDLKGQILCLVGAPGVGKTSICASIAKSLKRKYVRVSLGGVRDEAEIRGHRKTYIGSMPGRIITAIKQAGTANPLIVLDEIDKLSSDIKGDPSAALLEVLDSEQNYAFRDHFIELPFDLSECIFIATANTTETIPRALLDRMEMIRMKGYTPTEKLEIAKRHLIPKQLKRHGLTKRTLKIDDAAVLEIIESYTREQGVRNLEREIASICRRSAKKIVENEAKSVHVGIDGLKELLGKKKFKRENISSVPLIGIVNGLAWTESGGELLKVETLCMNGNGKIELTGTLGDVMKESARAAISLIRANAELFGIEDKDFYSKNDIHIHLPEGAVPKDGPSAGITMTTALVSLLSKRPVRSDIAMTGEITLCGSVLPIGGLREKASAAYSNGIREVIIPKENLDDLDEVDSEIRSEMNFIPVDNIFQVLKTALVESDTKFNSEKIVETADNGAITDITVPASETNGDKTGTGAYIQ